MPWKECCGLNPFFLFCFLPVIDEQLSVPHNDITILSFATALKSENQLSIDWNIQDCIELKLSSI